MKPVLIVGKICLYIAAIAGSFGGATSAVTIEMTAATIPGLQALHGERLLNM